MKVIITILCLFLFSACDLFEYDTFNQRERVKASNKLITELYPEIQEIGVKSSSVNFTGTWRVVISSNRDTKDSLNRFGGTIEYLYTVDSQGGGKCAYNNEQISGKFDQNIVAGVTFIPLKIAPDFLNCTFSVNEFKKTMDLSFDHHMFAIQTKTYKFQDYVDKVKEAENRCLLLAFHDSIVSYYCEYTEDGWENPYKYLLVATK